MLEIILLKTAVLECLPLDAPTCFSSVWGFGVVFGRTDKLCMALAADNNSSSETLFVSSGILSCVSMGTVAFTDLPKKWKKMNKIIWLYYFDIFRWLKQGPCL